MQSAVWQGDWAITQPFGCTSLTVEPWWAQAQCHWHCGVDIGMYTGTPLYAARAGRVSAVSYGILGIQVTGRTEIDYYVHIDSAAVGFGAQVAQGQLVAHSGAKVPSGGSLTGPHLHFEVNTGAINTPASSIDPVPVLQQTFGPGGGSLTADMTPEEHTWLQALYNFTSNPEFAKFNAGFDAMLTALKAAPASGGLTAAQQQQLNQVQEAVQRIETALKGA